MNLQVRLKPVFLNYSFGWSSLQLQREEDQQIVRKTFQELKSNLSSDVDLLEPVILNHPQDIHCLENDLSAIDVFFTFSLPHIKGKMSDTSKLGAMLGDFGKPVFSWYYHEFGDVNIIARLRSEGMEAYAPLNYIETNKLIHLFKAKKELATTKCSIFTSDGLPPVTAISGIWNLDVIKRRMGINVDELSIEKLLREIEKISEEKAEALADNLIENAEKVKLDRKHVVKSAKVYLALKNLMKERGANAVGISCGEPVLQSVARITPCVAFALLRDEGIPAVCEADISALIPMRLLTSLSGKSTFMGNLWPYDNEKNLVRMSHCTSGLRMNGLKETPLPYSLHEFHERDYGTSVYVDLEGDQDITLARLSPNADKIHIIKGTITKCHENMKPPSLTCMTTIDVKVSNARALLEKERDYGLHYAVVYGDYVEELQKCGSLLGIKAEILSPVPLPENKHTIHNF